MESGSSSAHGPERSASAVAGIVALALLVASGLNWALVGLFDVDLVAAVFGPLSTASRIVYVLAGVAAAYALTLFPRLTQRE